MPSMPFNQRLGLEHTKPIGDGFPEGARIALTYLLTKLLVQDFIRSANVLLAEIYRTGRFAGQDIMYDNRASLFDQIEQPLQQMTWIQVYTLCERIHDHVLQEVGHHEDDQWIVNTSKPEVQRFYSDELNWILEEENIEFRFVDGQFQRRGRAHTQKSFQRVGAVLSNPQLVRVRNHYSKARGFFDERPQPDVENCVKEAVCALEACLEILTQRPASSEFAKVIRQLQGNATGQIPPPIAEGMIKLHAYRGRGEGIAHAARGGNRVLGVDAELVLNLVASYVTYLVDLLSEPEDEILF